MKEYCTDTKACRHDLLLAYFGERFAAGRCDSCCDNCLAREQGTEALDDGIWLVSCSPSLCGIRLHQCSQHRPCRFSQQSGRRFGIQSSQQLRLSSPERMHRHRD